MHHTLLNEQINQQLCFLRIGKTAIVTFKSRNVKHKMLKMRKYFMPTDYNATKDEIQIIFKLRCKATELKTKLKGI
jgi:hypothetical protein